MILLIWKKRGDAMEIRIYKIEPAALSNVKKILETPDKVEETPEGTKITVNEFPRAGYTLRDSQTLGFEENCSYLYIKAEMDFFQKNEKTLLIEGVKKTEKEEFEKVKQKIEEEQASAEAGVGAVFREF
jgi:hypothetical protein